MSDELMLDSMGATPTGFEIKTHAGGPQTAETLIFIADSMRSMLDAYDAPNYLEMELKGTDHKRYIMTLQRQGRITPHNARMKAEAALDRVRDLHTEDVFRGHLSNGCKTCGGGAGWPCPTIAAITDT